MTDRVRVTVTIEPAVLRVFQRIADISGLSLARTIGDWCGQTCDGAQVVAQTYSQTTESPSQSLREMHKRAIYYQAEIERASGANEDETANRMYEALDDFTEGTVSQPKGSRTPLQELYAGGNRDTGGSATAPPPAGDMRLIAKKRRAARAAISAASSRKARR